MPRVWAQTTQSTIVDCVIEAVICHSDIILHIRTMLSSNTIRNACCYAPEENEGSGAVIGHGARACGWI